jgi:threonine/homoserine/homoserine lactone efflux protein
VEGEQAVTGQLAAFLGIAIVLIMLPGPDMALVMRNALLGGRASGLFTASGIVTGLAVWTLATSAGIATLLVASAPAFMAVKVVGAAYLCYLGAQAVWGALRTRGSQPPAGERHSRRRLAPLTAFRQGVISNLGNPKIAVFFTSFLPQFAPTGPNSFSVLLGLGLVFSALTLVWLVGYACAVARAGDVLRRPRVRRAIEGLSGAVLVAFGLRLATARR